MKWVNRGLGFLLGWRLFGPIVAPRWGPGQRHPWRVPGRTVFVGDHEFLVRQVGPETGKDVVLIHGLGGSSLAEWYEPAQRLADRYRLTLVDHRNHGLSPKVTGRFEVHDVADDIAAVMTEMGIGRADVVGYSMGGAIAQELAHRHPARVNRLVLIATFAFHPDAWRWARRIGFLLVRAWERLTGSGTPEVRASYLILTGAVGREYARWMWEETHRRDTEAGSSASFALLRFDSRPWIGHLEQPALVVIPLRDQLVPRSWQYDLAGRLRDVQVAEIRGARHEIPWTHPDDLVDAIDRFLK